MMDSLPIFAQNFDDQEYLGIEIEVNQKYLETEKWEMIVMGLKEVLFEILS